MLLLDALRCCDSFSEKWNRLIAESTLSACKSASRKRMWGTWCEGIIFQEQFGRAGIPGFNFLLWKRDWIKTFITFAKGWRYPSDHGLDSNKRKPHTISMQTRAHRPIICLGSKACASGSRRCECKCPCTVAQWFLVWKPLVPPCLPKSIQKQFNFNILNHAQSASSLSKHHRLFCAYRDSMLKKTSNQGLHVVMHTHRRPRRLKR